LPTIIDQLVLEFSLDPEKFTEGQKKVIANLEEIKKKAEQGTKQVAQTTQSIFVQIADFIKGLSSPIRLLETHLRVLSETPRQVQQRVQTAQQEHKKTAEDAKKSAEEGSEKLEEVKEKTKDAGEEIGKATEAGAIGLRGVAGAALVALAAITALVKGFEALKRASQETFRVGVGAAVAGMPVERYNQIQQALQQHGLVPPEETGTFLQRLGQLPELAKLGQISPEMYRALALAGVTNVFEKPEQILQDIARTFADLKPEEAVARGAGLGISPTLALALREAGPNFEKIVNSITTAVTPEQVGAAKAFNEAMARMEQQWAELARVFATDIIPYLIPVINFFTEIGKWLTWLLGGKPPPEPSMEGLGKGLPAPGGGAQGDPRGMTAVIRAAAEKYGIDPDVAMKVARSEGLGTYTGDQGTSFGAFQLHVGGGLGDEFKRDTGLDPSDPANEVAMIDYTMRRLRQTGWSPYHGAARAGVSDWEGIPGPHLGPQGLGPGPGYTPHLPSAPDLLPKGATWAPWITHLGDWWNQMSTPKIVQQGQTIPTTPNATGSGAQTLPWINDVGDWWNRMMTPQVVVPGKTIPTTNNNQHVSFGDIHVHTYATNGDDVVSSLKDALNRNLMIANVNTGLG
jgi:hypothetical protein